MEWFCVKLGFTDGKLMSDSENLIKLTLTVSSALGASAAINRMRDSQRKSLEEGRYDSMKEGDSLLALSCSSGYFELARVLLAMGANIDDRGSKGDLTPLMDASSQGHVEIVKILISHGAEINASSACGNSSLMYACAAGHEDVVRELLKAGAKVEENNENGHTPLMEASSAGHVGVAKILLDHGAGINTHSNKFKESALTVACYKGHLDMVGYLLEAGADQQHKTDEMHTALMEASMDGHVDVARLLLDSGAQVNMPADSFESPLSLAACGGHVELAKLLVDRGANIEEVNDEGYTPLMESSREGHLGVVKTLLRAGAKINAQTEETHETALTLAACGGFLDVVDTLINSGADIDTQNSNGASTALMEAAQEGHYQVVKYLLDHIAEISRQTQSGDTALSYACENGHADVVDLLISRGANSEHASEGGRTPLMKACRGGHIDVIRFLIQKGVDVNSETTNNDHTPLSLCCSGGHLQCAEVLLERGANPYHKLKDNSTMIIEAARGGHTNVIRCLLEKHEKRMTLKTNAVLQGDKSSPQCQQAQAKSVLRKSRSTSTLDSTSNLGQQQQQPLKKQIINDSNVKVQQQQQIQQLIKKTINLPQSETKQRKNPQKQQQPQQQQQQTAQNNNFCADCLNSTKTSPEQHQDHIIKRFASSAPAPAPAPPQLTSCGPPLVPSQVTAATAISERPKAKAYKPSARKQQLLQQQLQQQLLQQQQQQGATATTNIPIPPPQQQQQQQNQVPIIPGSPAITSSSNYQMQVQQIRTTSTSTVGENTTITAQTQGQFKLDQKLTQIFSSHQQQTLTVNKDQQSDLLEEVEALKSQIVPEGFDFDQLIKANEQFNPSNLNLKETTFGGILPMMANGNMNTTLVVGQGDTETIIEGKSLVPGLYKGLNMNTATETNGETSLSIASALGHYEVIEFLLTRKANIEHRDKKGCTPLILAADGGHEKVVELLLNHKAEIEAQSDRTKDTALSLACTKGRYEVVELLLKRGSNKEHRNISDYTPLSLAASGGYVNIIKLLLQNGAEINSRTGSKLGISPLMLAAMNGNVAAVKLLLDMGSDINASIETNKNTALTLACFQGGHEVVALLVDRKANIEHRAKTGLTPLMEAAKGGFTEVGKALLDKGAEINSAPVPATRDTALTITSDKGHYRFVELLLQRGAIVDARNKKGCTPLWLACHSGHLDVCQILYRHVADLDIQENRRISCLMAAFRKGHVKVIRWIVKHVTQFSSDSEMNRYLLSISNEGELLKKCQQCSEYIKQAKDKQALEANRNASSLLEELDLEKSREESKRIAAAVKREKKKKKKMEKRQVEDDDEQDEYNENQDEQEDEENGIGEIIDSGIDANSQGSISSNGKENKSSRNARARGTRGSAKQQQKEELPPPPSLAPQQSNVNNLNTTNKKKDTIINEEKSEESSLTTTTTTKNKKKKNKKNNQQHEKEVDNTTSTHYTTTTANNEKQNNSKILSAMNDTSSNQDSDDIIQQFSHVYNSKGIKEREKNTTNYPKKDDMIFHSSTIASKSASATTTTKYSSNNNNKILNKGKSSSSASSLSTVVTSSNNNNGSEYNNGPLEPLMGISLQPPQIRNLSLLQQQNMDTISSVSQASSKSMTSIEKGSGFISGSSSSATSIMNNHNTNSLSTTVKSYCNSSGNVHNNPGNIRKDEGWKEVIRNCTSSRTKKVIVSSSVISRVIGRSGCNINAIRDATGAHIEVEKQQKGQVQLERTIQIKGTGDSTKQAHDLITALMNEPDLDVKKILPTVKLSSSSMSIANSSMSNFSIGDCSSDTSISIDSNKSFTSVLNVTSSSPASSINSQLGASSSFSGILNQRTGNGTGSTIKPLIGKGSNFIGKSPITTALSSPPIFTSQQQQQNKSQNSPPIKKPIAISPNEAIFKIKKSIVIVPTPSTAAAASAASTTTSSSSTIQNPQNIYGGGLECLQHFRIGLPTPTSQHQNINVVNIRQQQQQQQQQANNSYIPNYGQQQYGHGPPAEIIMNNPQTNNSLIYPNNSSGNANPTMVISSRLNPVCNPVAKQQTPQSSAQQQQQQQHHSTHTQEHNQILGIQSFQPIGQNNYYAKVNEFGNTGLTGGSRMVGGVPIGNSALSGGNGGGGQRIGSGWTNYPAVGGGQSDGHLDSFQSGITSLEPNSMEVNSENQSTNLLKMAENRRLPRPIGGERAYKHSSVSVASTLVVGGMYNAPNTMELVDHNNMTQQQQQQQQQPPQQLGIQFQPQLQQTTNLYSKQPWINIYAQQPQQPQFMPPPFLGSQQQPRSLFGRRFIEELDSQRSMEMNQQQRVNNGGPPQMMTTPPPNNQPPPMYTPNNYGMEQQHIPKMDNSHVSWDSYPMMEEKHAMNWNAKWGNLKQPLYTDK